MRVEDFTQRAGVVGEEECSRRLVRPIYLTHALR
jgi:hypothetical protein